MNVLAVIFDLDGTLVQTRAASWEVFSRISDRFGLGVDSPEEYFALFQGNVFTAIRRLCRDDAHAEEVNRAFLASLRADYSPALIPGMARVIRTLAGHCTLAVMSSNAMGVLRRVLVDGGLAYCFAHVFGGDITPDKRTAIATFLADGGSGYGRRCLPDFDETGQAPSVGARETVLVTDTVGDVRDALAEGIRVVGVAWGMHGVDELSEAGAEFVALWPEELASYLLGDAAAVGPSGTCALPDSSTQNGPRDCGCGCGGACSASPETPATPAPSAAAAVSDPPVPSTSPPLFATTVAAAGAVRRDRRRAAARALLSSSAGAGDPAPPDELLTAISRVCGGS